ncbi:hypothetical protein BS78_04G125500 [Paspalum vaginatum]|nr:hypothetical protein BS78_04G125500 [Paspalum vaginatum]
MWCSPPQKISATILSTLIASSVWAGRTRCCLWSTTAGSRAAMCLTTSMTWTQLTMTTDGSDDPFISSCVVRSGHHIHACVCSNGPAAMAGKSPSTILGG